MKYNIPPGIYFTLLFLFFSCLLSAKGIDPQMDSEIKNRVESLNSSLSVRYNEEVKDKIWSLINSQKRVSEAMIGRSSIYFPLIEGALRERELPEDLKFLAVIESGLNPSALSKAKASGLWQFMKPTAKYIGLKITKAVDERRDPIKSTYAAMDYLKELHTSFGDWTLALAAYNCGPGNVRKAIRKAGGVKDYWVISKYLPSETRNYIPKVIAMHYIMNYYYLHDINPILIDDERKFTASVKVFDKTELKTLAEEYNLDIELIKELNPSFLKNFIPESDGKHYLTLPESYLYDYVNKRNAHAHIYHINILATKVAPKTFAEAKLDIDEIPSQEKRKKVEVEKISKSQARSEKGISVRNPVRVKFVKLKRGQTLLDLANEYEMSLSNLIADNNISKVNPPKQGDMIRITE